MAVPERPEDGCRRCVAGYLEETHETALGPVYRLGTCSCRVGRLVRARWRLRLNRSTF